MQSRNIILIFKSLIPLYIKRSLKRLIMNAKCFLKFGFLPPPPYLDKSGYEILLEFIKKYKIYKIPGDVVEIGAFLGGGTYKLCKFYEKYSSNKRIFSIDIFDLDYDNTACTDGIKMSDLYKNHLKYFRGKNQFEIFSSVTNNCKNYMCLSVIQMRQHFHVLQLVLLILMEIIQQNMF